MIIITPDALNAMRFDEASGINNVDYWRFILIHGFLKIRDSVEIRFNATISIDTISFYSISIDGLKE